jgi:hypothetical protein
MDMPNAISSARLAGLLVLSALFGSDASAQSVIISGARMTWYGPFTVSKGRNVTEPGGVSGVEVQATAVRPPMVNS